MPEDARTGTSHDAPDLEIRREEPVALGDATSDQVPAVPHGSRVLHIGAPKTGTTAVQSAIDATARGHGVHVPGTPNEQAHAALALLGQRVGWSQDPDSVPRRSWDRMTDRISGIEGTVFFSSEYLCEADERQIEQVAREIERPKVVLTLRPLEKILPSAWQQYLKSGHRRTYEQWLQAMFSGQKGVTPSFWRRHDQAAVAERWARVVGPENLTVVVLPPDDRKALFRTFEQLLGLPRTTLENAPEQRRNRSMTAAEAELFRKVNVTLRAARMPWADYAHLVRYGAILRTVERDPTGDPIRTPAWAVEKARERARAFAESIARLDPNVVGDLTDLHRGTAETPPAQPVPDTVEIEVAAEAVLGALARASTGATYFGGPVTTGLPGDVTDNVLHTPAGRLTSRQLAALLARRVEEGVRRRLHR